MFELTESHFEHVVSLLIAVSTSQPDSDDERQDDAFHLGAMKIDGQEVKWSPKGAERLLDFLNASVCVAGVCVCFTYTVCVILQANQFKRMR